MDLLSNKLSLLRKQPFLGPAVATVDGFTQSCLTSVQGFARHLILGRLPVLHSHSVIITEPDGHITTLGRQLDKTPKATNGESSARNSLVGRLNIESPNFWLRVLFAGDVGFAEAFLVGEITSPDITAVISILSLVDDQAGASWYRHTAYHTFMTVFGPVARKVNDIATARLNAVAHYSTSNEIFAAFLDETMTYSCPLWLDPYAELGTEALEDAQRRKLRMIARAARLKSTDRVLEIGGGWGSLALLAAGEFGCRVTTVTPSSVQCEEIRARAAAAGLSDLVDVLQCDYREIPAPAGGHYDKVVSVEMLEHVGRRYFADFFGVVDRLLKPSGGIAVFQSITIGEPGYEAYVRNEDFIKKYIFPGGELPCVSALTEGIWKGSHGRLVVEEVRSQGLHYAKALRAWRINFERNWQSRIVPELKRMNPHIGEQDLLIFKNKWIYYFCYCEAGFLTKSIGDAVIVVGRDCCLEFLDVAELHPSSFA